MSVGIFELILAVPFAILAIAVPICLLVGVFVTYQKTASIEKLLKQLLEQSSSR